MIFVFDDIELNVDNRELKRDGAPVPVEPKVFNLLEYMIRNRARVISRDELVETVWEGRFISDSAVSSAVKTARKLVGDNGRDQHTIKTVFGTGFRFIKDVRGEDGIEVTAPPNAVGRPAGGSNIRRSLTPLIGRDAEMAALQELVRATSLVSIVGPGGVGKSALAQAVGREVLAAFPGGAWFCELASSGDDQIASTILGSLDRASGAGTGDIDRIAERLGEAPTLLILDNCEHVIDAVAILVSELIGAMPTLTILTTSREALDVPGEQVFRIAGLGFETDASPAVSLFRQRADEVAAVQNTSANAATIREITARLEGLPLAIELAVPRLVSNSPGELLRALDDQLSVLASRRRGGSARHSTMDDAIAWSYELLDARERAVLLGLAAFRAPFTAEAAAAISGDDGTADALHRLVQQSMVVHVHAANGSRFKLLEPIRQFAVAQIDDETRAKTEARHAEWYATRVGQIAQALRGTGEISAAETLTAEWPDVRRAFAWGRDNQRPDIAIDPLLSLGIHLLWQLRIEGFDWLAAGIEACGLSAERAPRVKLVQAMGCWSAGELETSEALLQNSVDLGGETVETLYFRFYQAFAREDFANVALAGEAAAELAVGQADEAWKTTTAAFRIIGRTMVNPHDAIIPELFDALDARLDAFDWPTGQCCALLARLTSEFLLGNDRAGQAYQAEIDHCADRCLVPWFKITASGVGARSREGDDDAVSKLRRSAQNIRTAVSSGDVMQLPTLIRFAAMELCAAGELDSAATIIGLVPKIRGLGEKGTLAPGYDEAVSQVRAAMPADRFDARSVAGSKLSLEEAAVLLEAAVDRLERAGS